MIGYMTVDDWANLKAGKAKTVMVLTEPEVRIGWKGYFEHKGGPVRVEISEISDDAWKMRNWKHPEVFEGGVAQSAERARHKRG